jgi:BRCA1-associated protein
VPVKESDRKIEIVSERQWLERANSFPPPNPSVAIHPQTAVRDWRFGRVSLETIDLRTVHAMAGEASRTGPSAAPSLGPTFGGAGTATKAKFLPLETKNTELGWGVVHFYREGDETPGLTEVDHHESETANSEDNDCTTLCIPAVPAYMSPGDLMGFVGEKWTGDISHCRMVMTSRMNRYLALLKFRDNFRAKQWRREFDGRVFNTMEVSETISELTGHLLT